MQLKLRKRQKFVLMTAILSFLMLAMEIFTIDRFRLEAIVGLSVVSLVLAIWALREGLLTRASYLSLVMPVAFTASVGLFFFILPAGFLSRLPVVVLYSIGMYALMLTANIYTVSSIRTIALLRAAQAVGYVLSILTLFLLYDSIFSYKFFPWINGLLVGLASLPLYLAGVWSVEVNEKIERRLVLYSIVMCLVTAETALTLSFWPVTVTVGSLFLATVGYILLGLAQHELSGKLFSQNVRDYLMVGLVVYVTMFLTTRWGG